MFYQGYISPKLKNSSPTNRYNFSSSHIAEFGRSTNKFKVTKRYFSVKAISIGRYKQSEQKCAREVTVSGRSVSLMIEKIKKKDTFLMK